MIITIIWSSTSLWAGIYILAISPPPLGGEEFLSNLKNREEFGGGLEKGKEKGGKEENKEKSDKTHIKIPLWSLNTAKNPQKQGRIWRSNWKKERKREEKKKKW